MGSEDWRFDVRYYKKEMIIGGFDVFVKIIKKIVQFG